MQTLTILAGTAGMLLVQPASAGDEADAALRAALGADASNRAQVTETKAPSLKVSGEIQFRYFAVFGADQSGSDEDFSSGFEVTRARVKFAGDLGDPKIRYVVLGNFSPSSGNFQLDDGFVEFDPAEGWTMRLGQFKLPHTREFYGVAPTRQLAIDRSLADAVFRVDRSQGVQIGWKGERTRWMAAVSDGRKTKNTAYTDDDEADIALTARIEHRFGEAGWGQYKDLTAFRGDDTGVLVGLAGHWQQDGQTTAPAAYGDNANLFSYTADISYESDGYNLFGAVYGQTVDGDSMSFTDFGFTVQGGVFITDRDELFGRYSMVLPADERGMNTDNFSMITFGWNRYIIENSHAVKLTVEIGISPDTQAESSDLVGTQSKLGLLADDDDGQVAASAQLQVLF